MNPLWIFSNAIAVVTSLVIMSYLYHASRPVPPKLLVFSILVIGTTGVISGLQFVYPELLTALRRDPEAIRGGELWRLVTSLFVQPAGVGQCMANGFLILAFMPAAERLYGKYVLVIYFSAGFAGQVVNHFWNSGSGGSSTAIFGIMGGLLIYTIRKRKMLLPAFAYIAGIGLVSSVVMILTRDGHGVGLFIGALVASIVPLLDVTFRSTKTKTFPRI